MDEPDAHPTEEIEEDLRHIKDNGLLLVVPLRRTCPIQRLRDPLVTLWSSRSLFQPRLSGEFLDYTDEVQFSNASVRAAHLEQMTGGNYFLAFDLLEPFFKA